MKRAFGLFFLSLMMCTAVLHKSIPEPLQAVFATARGPALPAATVTFVEASTNATFKTKTDGSGEYVSPPLRPGNYKIGCRSSRLQNPDPQHNHPENAGPVAH